MGLFPLWNPPSHTHHHPVLSPAPSLTPSEPLSSSPSLPASVSPLQEGRDGALLLRSPRQSRTHPLGTSSPGQGQASRAPRCPGGLPCPQPPGSRVHRGPKASRWEQGWDGSRAGTGQDQATGAPARCSDSCQTSSPGLRGNSTFSRVSQPCPPLAAKPAAVL